MASTTAVAQGSEKPHTSSAKLEDQAALAALYVSKYDKSAKKSSSQSQGPAETYLDSDNRLSAAGAAASLKYANPQTLPSFPSSGLKKNDSAAGAAASLGWANQKPFEHWKPDPSASASAAAMKAKDYKMKELWQPESSAHGAKAALIAHKTGGNVEIWRPEADSPWGNSAATQAFKKFGAGGLSPVLDYGYTDVGRSGSLLAATGAMSESRKRAISIPDPKPKPDTYPDESNAVANALSAAASAHKTKRQSEIPVNGASPYTTMAREMFTSHPPVGPEMDEKTRSATLHASAVAMAKRMYSVQKKQADQNAQHGASAAHQRQRSSSDLSDEAAPMRFNNLHDAAQKLAQERLAKLHDEHAQNREYRDYYSGNTKAQPLKQSRLSMRGRARNRESTDGAVDEDDAEKSNKIRAQMSLFSSNLSQVDAKKRTADREALIAAAQRNVTKSLQGMDQRVFADTGKVGPGLLSDWEMKAHMAAQAKSDTRLENYGKVHIGGGKFIAQSEIDAIARGNVQPVLDEINEKAAAEHERQATAKAEQQENTKKAADKKQKDKESKSNSKKLKQQERFEEAVRLRDEKEAQKRASKDKRSSRAPTVASGTAAAVAETESGATERSAEPVDDSAVERVATEPVTTPVIEDQSAVERVATEPVTAPVTEDETAVERVATEPVATSAVEDESVAEPTTSAVVTESHESTPVTTGHETVTTIPTSKEEASPPIEQKAEAANAGESESAPLSPGAASPEGKGKRRMSWLRKFSSRRSSKGQTATPIQETPKEKTKEDKAFVGGAALTGAPANSSTVSLTAASPESVPTETKILETETAPAVETVTKAVPEAETSATINPATELEVPAIAAQTETEIPVAKFIEENKEEERVGRSITRDDEVSPISATEDKMEGIDRTSTKGDDEDEFQEARDNFDEDLAPPPTFPAEKSSSPAREAKFTEVI